MHQSLLSFLSDLIHSTKCESLSQTIIVEILDDCWTEDPLTDKKV